MISAAAAPTDGTSRDVDVDAPPTRTEPTLPAHLDPAIIEAATITLRELHSDFPSLLAAMVLTDDGFEIARTPALRRRTDAEPDHRLASMASSMQALSEAVSRELALGTTGLALIEADGGRVLFRRVPDHEIVLAAVLRDDDTIGRGMALTARLVKSLSVALRIARVAGESDAPPAD
ncbi:roadblock/LC7 domain-containing protein [Salinibacterium sp. ZJ70]|uniref:roadblock/LC7 domain-containing protein n=1 Tax=Salinibacterium sp. ZJ70 TaxID=2708084 RepID=UPI00141DA7FB|nr:roadblock/LC7 domain-containing protein [Salinibacterium sp. ZJ70]